MCDLLPSGGRYVYRAAAGIDVMVLLLLVKAAGCFPGHGKRVLQRLKLCRHATQWSEMHLVLKGRCFWMCMYVY